MIWKVIIDFFILVTVKCKSIYFISIKFYFRRFIFEVFGAYLEVFSIEQLHPHDGKYEPENETHEQHVYDGRNRANESVHHNLRQINDMNFFATELWELLQFRDCTVSPLWYWNGTSVGCGVSGVVPEA